MLRHVLLSMALLSTSAVSFADFVSPNNLNNPDRLENLSRSLSAGSYSTSNHATSDDHDEEEEFTSTHFTNQSLNRYNTLSNSDQPVLGEWLSTRPIQDARVSSGFGIRSLLGKTRRHNGIDFAAPTGTAIYATGSGIVTYAGWGHGWGNYVEVDHGNGYITRYAHASHLNVHEGEQVKAGEHIADVGCTGRCTGSHLHFEIIKAGYYQNPSTYLALLP